jgi:chromosome segregation ATPase
MEKNRLQGTLRDLDRGNMEAKQQINALTEDLTKAKDAINQKIAEEKQLQARMNSQSDERDRAQQQINQLGKQVSSLRLFPTQLVGINI